MKGWNKDKVRRKTYYFIGSVLAIVHFFMFYAYFFYQIGKYPGFKEIGSGILQMIYFLILIAFAIGQYRSPYHERRNSIVSVLLYGIPLVLVLLMILVSGDFRIEENVFPLVLVSIFGLNLINYGLSVFAEE